MIPRATAIVAVTVLLLGVLAPELSGHAVVFPRTSGPGAYEKYVLRVPNERDVPTIRIELAFPDEVRVVSFAEVEGWELRIVRDAGGEIERAVWSGELPVMRFIELPFVAVNPTAEIPLVWAAVQVYANGERVEWFGPEDSSTPASVTRIMGQRTGPGPALWIAAVALILAFLSLGLALRRPQISASSPL